MNIYEYAKGMELDGKSLYEQELQRSDSPAIRSILQMLIKQEQKHYEILDALEAHKKDAEVRGTSFEGTKNLFQQMRAEGVQLPDDDIALYERVLDIERRSEEFYRKHAEAQASPVREQLVQLAKEEHRHAIIIEQMLTLLRRPDQWVEDAEFNEIEDY
ncbi:MAG: hypothetical protein ACOCWQ_01660 [Nanoarchaeota archaeon]